TASITGLIPGNYTVSITDANGCPVVGGASITEPAILQANAAATAVTGVNANDGQAIAQPTGGTSPYTYAWSTGSSVNAVNGLIPGNYIVTVTDANNCTAVQTVTVNAFNCALVTSVTTTYATCPENTDGSATILVGGGTAPYAYTWSSGDSVVTATGLAAGTYTVSVTDAAGCSITATATIIVLDIIAPTLACPGNIFLCGADLVNYTLPVISDNCNLNASVPTLVSGQASGTAFDDGVTTQVFSAADAAGNTATCSFTITIFPIPDILVDSVQNDLGSSSSGRIYVTAVGGVGPYVFIWEKDGVFFSNEEDLTGLQTGNYRLVITDANGCGGALAPVFIDNIVGTANPLAQISIRVWPNPAQTGIWVKMNDLTVFSAEMLNAQGRLVQTITPADLADFLSVEYLPNGVYYLKIVDSMGKTRVAKWIKSE
ncbi:MAG: T9SS type A sorting domain-containing protein, partial [Saprospiraceae bacterium]|nr:T9SS type A sorting domain-containing protein [Saprospiraceae bacterium]